QGTIGTGEVVVVAAGARVGRGQFGVTEGADEGEHAARPPDSQGHPGAGHQVKDVRRRLEDAGPDDDADDDAGRVEEAEPGLYGLRVRSRLVHSLRLRHGLTTYPSCLCSRGGDALPTKSTRRRSLLLPDALRRHPLVPGRIVAVVADQVQ